jgi:hypothetical protein
MELMAAIKVAEEKWNKEHGTHADHSEHTEVQGQDDLPKVASKSSKLGWGLLLGFLLSVSALAALYKDALMAEAEHMKEYLTGPQWDQGKKNTAAEEKAEAGSDLKKAPLQPGEVSDTNASATSSAPSAGVGMSSSTKPPPVKADDSLIPDREAILSPEKPDNKDASKGLTKEAPKEAVKEAEKEGAKEGAKETAKDSVKESLKEAQKEPPRETPKEAKTLKPAEPAVKEAPLKIPVLKDPPLAEPKSSATKVKEEKALSKEMAKEPPKETAKVTPKASLTPSDKVTPPAWVSALPAKAWVLQLAAMPTKAEILTLKEETPAFASAQVLLTQNPQSKKPYYILVRGPFASKEVAQNLMSSTPSLAKAWLRSAQSLKTQFEAQSE